MTRADIVALGLKLRVPYELTWSRYEGKSRPCLSCGTCLERTEAFLLNNVKDPLLSDEEGVVKIYKENERKYGVPSTHNPVSIQTTLHPKQTTNSSPLLTGHD